MCGIAGIIGEKASEAQLNHMLFVQKHRGPDNTATYISDNVVLGHNRLSIIDLSVEANQPFISENKRYVILFNGEIYNYIELKERLKPFYSFKTSSDTEVLLAAYIVWKEDCLHELNGMFSFAIWDESSKTLFAARDRFGVKPFYYSLQQNELYFASEIKGLFAAKLNRHVNERIWANYFTFGSYGMPYETFWEGIVQLPGGHYLRYQNNTCIINRWYDFVKSIESNNEDLDYGHCKIIYEKLLLDSIKLRFRADVPVGFNVSGGVDSSTLLALVNKVQNNHNIQAYTFYTDDKRYDELPWVKELVNITNNPLLEVLLEPNDVEKLSLEISKIQDEPYGGIPTLAYSKIFKMARLHGVLVLLDGQGMDEQWAGYDYYFNNNKQTIQGVSYSPYETDVLNLEFAQLAVRPDYPQPFDNTLQNLQYRDLFYTKIPRALRFNDRISMASSVELREPFLDYRLVEFAFKQPRDLKIKNGIQKFLLRDLISDYLSDSITYAPKRPIQTPQREWLGNELTAFVDMHLENLYYSKYNSWFKFEELNKSWQRYKDGQQDSSFYIWQWINFSMLVSKF